ncbi:hypothetical protein [Streptomyces lavendulocolor]|uniref:hypothetical protein n=1 Tax=Streptomyces lavendulocolor TaxID=67316 RepID=UPI003C2DAB33
MTEASTPSSDRRPLSAIGLAITYSENKHRHDPPAEPQHTADTITSDALDRLYERLHKAERAANLLADAHQRAEQVEDLLRVAHETSNRSEAERALAVQRAEHADAVTAETKRLMERRTKTLRERAERAEAALDRVRDLAEQWQATVRPEEPHPAARAVLAALDEPKEPRPHRHLPGERTSSTCPNCTHTA